MGRRNYLVEGVSGAGKTSVATELQRRGYHVIHGDRQLAYQGDPETGEPLPGTHHGHHIWKVDEVRALVADHSNEMTFFCGGSRNFHHFIALFDAVFVLELDWATLDARLSLRPEDEFGRSPEQRALVKRVHATREDLPRDAVAIDATAPLGEVVDAILAHCR